ncbi:hypothetical protein BDW69DRAFT_167690 [Aspergillus filifer]
MLQAAVAATIDMPNLKILKIWNGREGLAMLFRYRVIGGRAELNTKGTWQFALRPSVVQAWEEVARKHHEFGSLLTVEELLDPGVLVNSHGDAIHHLKLLNPVVGPFHCDRFEGNASSRGANVKACVLDRCRPQA